MYVHIIWFDDNNMPDMIMSDTVMSDNNMSDNEMSKANTSCTFLFDDNALSNIPKTWLHYLNGPNDGLIDIELARQEMPGLVGATQQSTFHSVLSRSEQRRNMTVAEDEDNGAVWGTEQLD